MSTLALLALSSSMSLGLCLALAVFNHLDEFSKRRITAESKGRIASSLTLGSNRQTLAKGQRLSKNLERLYGLLKKALSKSQLGPAASRLLSFKNLQSYDNELAMIIDITALGIRAGMAFDQAFELALRRLPGQLTGLCLSKLDIWQKGLISREQGLHELEEQIQTVLFSRFSALVLRALHYGAPMAQLLTALSVEARREIRIRREEEVAKAPVKMLIPTGALILPAMLLLVLGPIMIDLLGNM
ncbi:MAG: type II secretion system F family protein [Coriobacteriia bacterium]|nr:type II secretion system F family protein [Coriobacteriia bacterium]